MMPGMHIEDIRQRLRALGAKPAHEERVLRHWAQALPQDAGRRRIEDFLPLALRQALPELMARAGGAGAAASEHAGEDGSQRLLLQLADGQTRGKRAAAARRPVRVHARSAARSAACSA